MKNTEYKLLSILNNTTTKIVVLDASYKIIFFNKAAGEIIKKFRGIDFAEGHDFRDYVAERNKHLFLNSFDKALRGQHDTVETEIHVNPENMDSLLKTGVKPNLWFQFDFNPVFDSNQAVEAVSIHIVNIDERKRLEIALQQSEKRFRSVMEAAADPIIIADQLMRVNIANPETNALFGYSSEELQEMPVEKLIPGFTEHLNLILQKFDNQKDGYSFHIEALALKKNGVELKIEAGISAFLVENDIYFQIIVCDLTKRIVFEEQLKKANLELSLLNRVNDIILSVNDEQCLLDQICRVIVEEGKYRLAWICEKPDESDPDQCTKPVSSFGVIGYLDNIKIDLSDSLLGKGPTATVLRTGLTVITNNVSLAERFKPWLDNAIKFGISSSIVVPILIEGKVHGCLNIYSANINAFDDFEVGILERLSDNLSLAIKNIRVNHEKEKAQNELKQRVRELNAIYQISEALQNEDQSISKVLNRIVNLIPKGFRFTDNCFARILFDEKEYFSDNFYCSSLQYSSEFNTIDGNTVIIEICYQNDLNLSPNDLFNVSVQSLLANIGEMLVVFYNKKSLLLQLKKSEANLASVFENTEVGHMLLDKDLKVLAFNKKLFDGYLNASGIEIKKGDYFNELILDIRKEMAFQIFDNVRSSRLPYLYDTSFDNNGKVFHFSVSMVPVFEQNEITGFCLSAIDITDRKKKELERQNMIAELEFAQNELNDKHILLKAVLESAQDSIVVFSPDYTIISFNEIASRFYKKIKGVEIKIGDPYKYHIEGFEQLSADAFQDALNGKSTEFELEAMTFDGIGWLMFKFSPVYKSDKELLGVSRTVRNIDKRKRAEITIRENEEKFRKILESATVPILILNSAMNIVIVNPETEGVFGYKRDELINQNIQMLIPERFHSNHTAHQESYVKASKPYRMGFNRLTPALRKDGEEIIVDVALNYFTIRDEKFIIAIAQDITQRIKDEKKIADQLARLETIAWLQSHEVRRPVANILGLVSIIDMEKHNGYNEEYLTCLKEATEDLDSIIHKIVLESSNDLNDDSLIKPEF